VAHRLVITATGRPSASVISAVPTALSTSAAVSRPDASSGAPSGGSRPSMDTCIVSVVT
jgi:hypothetical protein